VPATSLDDLAAVFLAGTLPRQEWTHLAHLRVGAWHVHRFGAAEALARMRVGIRRLNDAHGTANTNTGGYHETITAAYVSLIGAFLARLPCPACLPAPGEPAPSLETRVDHLLAGPLADRAVLLRFWSREVLMSPRARASWVPPDLAPLLLPDQGHPASPRPPPHGVQP
jgi:hypothetical protein